MLAGAEGRSSAMLERDALLTASADMSAAAGLQSRRRIGIVEHIKHVFMFGEIALKAIGSDLTRSQASPPNAEHMMRFHKYWREPFIP